MTTSAPQRADGSPAAARLQVVAAAVCFSTGGAAIKACQLTSWQVASFRSAVAAIAVFTLLPAARRGLTRRAALVGVAYSSMLLLFALANKLTTAANTIFLQSTAPLYVLLLGPWLLKEPLRRNDIGFMFVIALGLGMFFVSDEAPLATAPDPFLGNILAACAGVGWALTIAGLRWLSREPGDSAAQASGAVVIGNLFAFLIAAPFAFPVTQSRPADWALIVFIGVFQIGASYALMTKGLEKVTALEASLLLLVEPVLNPVWAWLVHGETPGAWPMLGGSLVLGATTLKSVLGARWERRLARRRTR